MWGWKCPEGDVFESQCLYIYMCYVSWKKPTASKNSNRTNGYFPVRGDNSGTTLNESLGGVPPAAQIVAPPRGRLTQLDLCGAMIWWTQGEETWEIPSGVSQRFRSGVWNSWACHAVTCLRLMHSVCKHWVVNMYSLPTHPN